MNILFAIIILLTAIPAGMLLTYLTSDELKQGRKYFKLIFFLSLISAIILFFLPINEKIPAVLALIYFAIVTFISYIKT